MSTPACQGMFELIPKAIIGKNTVTGPTITLEVQPDPFKPISVEMEFDGKAVQAGASLPGMCSMYSPRVVHNPASSFPLILIRESL